MTHADSIWAKALEMHNDSLQRSVDALQAKLEALQSKTDLLTNVVETANDGVSNQLSSATHLLEVIAILIAIGGFVLGSYISHKKRQIEKMAQTVDNKKKVVEELAKVVDEKKDSVDVIAKATEELDRKIHHDIKGLYFDLRKEETRSLFQRLVAEPEDIDNLGMLLLARDVDGDNFPLLKEAYFKLPEEIESNEVEILGDIVNLGTDYKHSYMLQFFQHFFYESLKDEDMQPVFTENFKNVFGNGFESDIVRATESLCKALTDEDTKFDKLDVLTNFLKAINGCKYKNFVLLRKILDEKVKPDLLQQAINKCTSDGDNLVLFGTSQSACKASGQ